LLILDSDMSWFLVTLQADAGHVNVLSDALLQTGAVSVDVTDAYAGTPREHVLFAEPGESDTLPWELVNLRALFDEGADVAAMVAAALRAANLDPKRGFDVERVADRDWVRATQSQFQPVRLSSRLWVVPSWHAPPDPGAINLIIDPGLAFGTGTHPTTRLCLNWLDANLRGGETVLDYGCGSGILAIAAVKLGALRSVGVDIDPAALLAARHNAMQNQADVRFEDAHESVSSRYDIVLANILASPLQLLAPLLGCAVRSGGRIVLSGILEHQADEVGNAYLEWFDMNITQRDESWVLLAGIKR
jgi:ribosomal protein L11 methyltransferase